MNIHGHIIHGHRRRKPTCEYNAWIGMKERCLNPRNQRFKDYGGRGIKIHQPWIGSFKTFLADVGRCPGIGHSLDRFPNNDGNYEPGNVRWANRKQQGENRRNVQYISAFGKTMIISDWAKITGTPKTSISRRLKGGWSSEDCVSRWIPQSCQHCGVGPISNAGVYYRHIRKCALMREREKAHA